MRNYKVQDASDYILSADPLAQPKLQALRRIIKATVPEAQEKISWGIPFYWYHGALAGISSFKNHVGFGFSFQLDALDREKLEKAGYKTGSKTVQIKFDQEVPEDIIKQILLKQAKENEEKA